MSEIQPNQPLRPAPEQIQERIAHYKEDRKINKSFHQIIWEYEDMAEGGDADGIRQQFYPGWADEDFQTVLDALQEPENK